MNCNHSIPIHLFSDPLAKTYEDVSSAKYFLTVSGLPETENINYLTAD